MTWATVVDNAKYKEWEYDGDIPLNANLTLDVLALPAGNKKVYLVKRVSGTPGATDQQMTCEGSVQLNDGTWFEVGSFSYHNTGGVLTALNGGNGLISNGESSFQIINGNNASFGTADVQSLAPFPTRIEFDYLKGTEASAAVYDRFAIACFML